MVTSRATHHGIIVVKLTAHIAITVTIMNTQEFHMNMEEAKDATTMLNPIPMMNHRVAAGIPLSVAASLIMS
jgi:hypothetical protein